METKAHRARMEAMVRLDLKDRLVLLALRVLTAMKVYQALMGTKAHRALTEATAQLGLKDLLVLLALRVLTAMKVHRVLMGTKAHRALTEATAQLGLKDRPDQQEIWALMVTMARTGKTVRTQTSSSLAPEKRCSLMATS